MLNKGVNSLELRVKSEKLRVVAAGFSLRHIAKKFIAPYFLLPLIFVLLLYGMGYASLSEGSSNADFKTGTGSQGVPGANQSAGDTQMTNINTLLDSNNITESGKDSKLDGGNNKKALANKTAKSSETPNNTKDPASDKLADKLPETKLAQADTSQEEDSTDSQTPAQTSSASSSSSGGAGTTPTASYGGVFSSIKMDPQINTGTAATNIPIEVPPGRKDMTPKLSLNYISSKKNGWLGVGWMLDVGAIQRETRWGLDYNANDYNFVINDSSSELVPRGDWGANYYGAKIEGEFSKYYYNSTTKGWEVTAKNGTKYYFGSTSYSRQDDPDDANRIFKWCLDRVEDTNGNYMEILYTKDQGEIYLSKIKYTGSTAGLAPANSVKFILDPAPRTDAYEVYTTHFPVKTAYRLKTIEVYGNGQLARRYELNYSYSPSTLRTLLASITLYGSNGNPLPPVTFTYSEMVPGFDDNNTIEWYPGDDGDYNPVRCTYSMGAVVKCDLFDMTGDALPDRVIGWAVNDNILYHQFDPEIDPYISIIGNFLQNNNSILMDKFIRLYSDVGTTSDMIDMNGDGLPDRVTSGGADYLEVYLSNFSQTKIQWHTPISNSGWPQNVRNNEATTPYNIGTYQDIIDMNGDGLPDRVTNGDSTHLKVFLNTGSGFSNTAIEWYTPNVGYPQYIRNYSQTNYTSQTYQDIIDMNGDGLPDRVTNGDSTHLKVFLNTGSGFSNTAIDWYTPNNGYPQYIRDDNQNLGLDIIDMNGDGLPDRVTSGGTDYLNVYLNTGSGFSAQVIEWHTPECRTIPSVSNTVICGLTDIIATMVDFNGDGLVDRVQGHEKGTTPIMGSVYPSNGPFPDLLINIDNGLGGNTQVQYASSAQFADAIYGKTYLPFVQQVVSEVRVKDGKGSESITTFHYDYGLYSTTQKEFRGFGYVKSTDPNATTTETWFHQDDIFKGRIDKQIITDSSGNIYTWIENTYQSTIPYTGVDYPYLSQTDNDIYDGDNNATPRHIINQFTYDNYGNVTSKYYAENPLQGDEKTEYIEYYYDTTNWIVSLPSTKYVKDSNGITKAQTSYEYYPDGKGNLWKKTRWFDSGTDPVTVYTYDAYGNVETITDPKNNTQTITYDSTTYTYPIEIKNALNQSTQMTYDLNLGNIISKIDSNNNTITYDYDEFGRLIKVTNSAPYGITEYLYQNYGDPYTQNVREEAQDQYGTLIHWKEMYFDGLGRTTSEWQDGPGTGAITVDTEYNLKGLVYKKSYPYFGGGPVYKTTYTYDPLDRLIQTDNPDGTSSTISYDRGRVTYIDANGHKKVAERDIYERIIKIEEYFGDLTTAYTLYTETYYEYDVLNNLTKVIDAKNNQTTITYDTLSRKTSMDDPDMGHWTYEYDANGNLTAQTDAMNQRIEFQYDELNRIILKDYPTGTDITYTYDEAFSANSTGRLTTLTDASGTTKFYYDEMGQISRMEKTIDSTTYTTQTQYDALGRVEKIIYPDNTEIDYTYDGNGNIKEIKSGAIVYVTYDSYTAIGNPLLITFNNGVTTQYQYYPENNRLQRITTNHQSNGIDFMDIEYFYDSAGNITKIIDHLDSSKTRDFVYDDLDRLIEADSPSYGGKMIYQYDKIGNMTYNCRYGYYEYDYSDKPHAVRRIVKNNNTVAEFFYDANGNMEHEYHYEEDGTPIQGLEREFTYDYDNMPTSISKNSQATINTYDAFGNRVQKTVPTPVTTTYLGQIYEHSSADGDTKYLFAGTKRVASIKGTETYYYHTDHLQSSSVITDKDGNSAQEIYYYPYGEIKTSSGSLDFKHKYTGKEWDAETGLYYYGARYYDPKLAKFISADTIVPLPFYPQSFNRYSYAYNNPIVLRDINGHCVFLSSGPSGNTVGSSSHGGSSGGIWGTIKSLGGAIWNGITNAATYSYNAIISGATWTYNNIVRPTYNYVVKPILTATAGALVSGGQLFNRGLTNFKSSVESLFGGGETSRGKMYADGGSVYDTGMYEFETDDVQNWENKVQQALDKCDQIDKAFKNAVNAGDYSSKELGVMDHIKNFFKGIGDSKSNNALTIGEHGTAAGLGYLNIKCYNLQNYMEWGQGLNKWGTNNPFYGTGGAITRDGKYDW